MQTPSSESPYILRCGLIGIGSVGRKLIRVIQSKIDHLRDNYHVRIELTLIQDSSALLIADPARNTPFDIDYILQLKEKGLKLESWIQEMQTAHERNQGLPKKQQPLPFFCSTKDPNYNRVLEDNLSKEAVEILFEASPVNLKVRILLG